MEYENEVRVALSPGARVVMGSPVLPLFGAVVIGFVLGVAFATLRRRCQSGGGGAAPLALRMPSDNPDVETEL